MQFVKKFSDQNSKQKPYVFLDLEGVTVPNCNFDIDPYLCFNISTYKLMNQSDMEWNIGFGTTHKFLKSCTPDEQAQYAELLLAIHWRIKSDIEVMDELDGEKVLELERLFSKWINDFAVSINLMKRLEEFTERHIVVPRFDRVGERPKDSIPMTYFKPDYLKLAAIVLLCKMMLPIFGVFMEALKKKSDTSLKENHCAALLGDILAGDARQGYEKLCYFVRQIAKPFLNNIGLRQEFAGITSSSAVNLIISSLCTRRFITVDMTKRDGNLIKYVTACVRNIAGKQCSNGGVNTSVGINTPPSDKISEEEGNLSTLETESRSSNQPADYTSIIRMAVKHLCRRMLTEFDMDRKVWQQCVDYYSVNHVYMTPFNSYMLGNIFGPSLGGAPSVEMLDGWMLANIVPVFQMFCINQGYYDLVDAASLIPTGQPKSNVAPTDTQLVNSFTNHMEYRACNQRFQFYVNDLKWDTGLKAIIQGVTSENMIINTAPPLTDMLGREYTNGQTFYPPVTFAQTICNMLLNHI